MAEPIIDFEFSVQVDKVMRIPDRRFKSGYRKHTVLATTVAVMQPNMAQQVHQSHYHDDGKHLFQTHVMFNATVDNVLIKEAKIK